MFSEIFATECYEGLLFGEVQTPITERARGIVPDFQYVDMNIVLHHFQHQSHPLYPETFFPHTTFVQFLSIVGLHL